jgi:peptidoglycan-N-acetylglucosamine deacetylase
VPGTLTLTFDDGPGEDSTAEVLAALARAGVRATFFVVGERVQASPELASAVLESGHDVQLHCHEHRRHSDLTEQQIERDTARALELLDGLGISPRFWRAPWGVRTAASEAVAARHGLTLVGWDIDTHDWRGDSVTAMLASTKSHLPDGGLVLMHDALGPGSRRPDCRNTVELVPALVAAARNAGMKLDALCPTSPVRSAYTRTDPPHPLPEPASRG